jgi:folate-binding protein YgfZ
MFKLRSKIDLSDVTESYAVVALLGDGLPIDPGPAPGNAVGVAGGVVFRDPRMAALGVRAILPQEALERLGMRRLPLELYERRRLELGVPDGSRDMPVEKAILLENNIDALNGISWDKGCYMGQELTARTKYRGLVKKRLFPVVFEGEPPEPGSLVRDGDREIGEMRTSLDGRGLALLRLDGIQAAASGGRPLTAAGVEIRPMAEMAMAGDRES